MTSFTLRSARDSGQLLIEPAPRGDESFCFSASLAGPRLSASVEVYEDSPHGLVEYFAGLSALWWKGWEGERTFASLEGHLELVASRDALGRVHIRVSLCDNLHDPCWSAAGTLEVEAGQLPNLAEQIRLTFAQ